MVLKSSWLQRLFGLDIPQNPPSDSSKTHASAPTESIPPEQVGLDGEQDPKGLVKRVALAFDEDPDVDDIETVYLAQKGGTVAFKGKVPSQAALDRLVSVAQKVSGVTGAEVDQVTVGSTEMSSGSGVPDA